MTEINFSMPIEFIGLTGEQKYTLIIAESTKITTEYMFKIMGYSAVAGLVIGVLITFIYFQYLKNIIENWQKK